MPDGDKGTDVPGKSPGDEGAGTYEPPRLIPLGNLHDLLAGGTSQCDVDGSTGQGGAPGSC